MKDWKDIEGYEGIYQVSSEGLIKSLERTVLNKNGKFQYYPEKLLKFDIHSSNTTSYCRVTLCKDHKIKRFCVHRIVAATFIPNLDGKPCVNHKDNNGLNNSVSNLEWCTHSENMLHAQKQGRLREAQSKGGKVGSLPEVAKAISNCTAMINSVYGKWKVIEYLGKQGNGKGKHYVLCACLGCNKTIQRVQATRLTRGEAANCRRCGQVKRKI